MSKKTINQSGRSMIEMLGVLAIIGVLSIGGIAGYSKAIYKHKLNKQAEQYSHIIAGAMDLELGLMNNNIITNNPTSIFFVTGIIPKEMQKNNDTNFFYDAFDNSGRIYIGEVSHHYYIATGMTNKPFEQCKNIIEVAKAYHEFVHNVRTWKQGIGLSQEYYGDKYCNTTRENNKQCLKDMTPVLIETICSRCKSNDMEQGCTVEITLGSAIKNNTYGL